MSDMTPFEEAVFAAALPRVKAWELLHDPEHGGRLTFSEFYDLAITAGYSEEEAQKAANQRGWERLAAGVMM